MGGTEAGARPTYGELAWVFLRISLLGFGGPSAHLALMLDEVVEKRRWVTREHFLHLAGTRGPCGGAPAVHARLTASGKTRRRTPTNRIRDHNLQGGSTP
jgi:hypothetical protein